MELDTLATILFGCTWDAMKQNTSIAISNSSVYSFRK